MAFHLLELHPPCWTHPCAFDPAPATDGWRFFAECAEDDGTTCDLLFSDPSNFGARTYKDFINFLDYLYEAAKGGQRWQDIFKDGQLFHPVHEFKVKRRATGGQETTFDAKVMQWKKRNTNIRILMLESGAGRLNIFISHAFEKDSAQTPAHEQRRAEDNIRRFLEALDAGQLQLIKTQGGRNATPNFR